MEEMKHTHCTCVATEWRCVMLQIAIGFLVALLSLIFASKMYASGKEYTAKQCDTFGAFEVSGVVYQCSKKESK